MTAFTSLIDAQLVRCSLPGVDKRKMLKLQPGGSRNCPSHFMGLRSMPAEKFWGCADIRIS